MTKSLGKKSGKYLVKSINEDRWEEAEIQILNRDKNCASSFIETKDGELFIVMSHDWDKRVKEWK